MVLYKTMDKWILCVVALILGMLMFHMLKGVCGCKVVEGYEWIDDPSILDGHSLGYFADFNEWVKPVYGRDETGVVRVVSGHFHSNNGENYYAMREDGNPAPVCRPKGSAKPACNVMVVPGSFAETCTECSYSGGGFDCKCLSPGGGGDITIHTSADYYANRCYGNDNGKLYSYYARRDSNNKEIGLSCNGGDNPKRF